MTPAELLLLAAMLAPGIERTSGAAAAAQAVSQAVQTAPGRIFDDDPSGDTDAATMLVYAWKESSFQATVMQAGVDHPGRGMWQLVYAPAAVAFDPPRAARLWLAMALAGKRACSSDPLRSLSGGTAAASSLAKGRVAVARRLLARLRAAERARATP
jgi:hypothetical protein